MNKKSKYQYLFLLLKPYKKSFLITLMLIVIGAVGVIVGPKIFGEITTLIIQGFSFNNNQLVVNLDYAALYSKILFLTGVYILITIVNYFRDYVMGKVASSIAYELRVKIDQKINKMPIAYLDTTKDGDIISTVINDVNTLFEGLTQSLAQGFYSIILVIGILSMMLSISVPLTLIPVLSIPVIVVIGMTIMRLSKKYFTSQQTQIAELNVQVEELLANFTTVQSYNGQAQSLAMFKKVNDELVKNAQKGNFLSGMLFPLTAFINNIAYVLAVIFGSRKVISNALNIGELQSFIQYMQQFTGPLQQISQLGQYVQSCVAASERIVKLLDAPEMQERDNLITLPEVAGNVTFENVNFSYVSETPVIKNFSLDVKAGSTVAIVGATGAGKTTLINLLMRFYEINDGVIKLDGVDMRDISYEAISSTFSMVLQDTWLFNGSIKDNIAYGNQFTSDAEIEMAAKFANADHFIRTLPQGYDTVINEDSSNISQGQKQLLTIARAFLGNKKILILDEATSSVDTRTEKLIQEAMNKLMYGRTAFIIAHRLSTIKNADIILVMDKGNVVEKGTHEELLQLNKVYASLYQSQFENI